MPQHKSSRQAANRRYYERNRERILQLRRASRNDTRARLQFLDYIIESSQHQMMQVSRPIVQASRPEEDKSETNNYLN
ncbi:24600_t:CDS:1, partial [Cetraspora pellucida]